MTSSRMPQTMHAGEADPHGPLLEVGVGLHADGHQDRGDGDDHQRRDEDAGAAAKPVGRPIETQDAEDRLDRGLDAHVGVDRCPEPQDEPPAHGRDDEADGAVEDACHPHVVATRARHGGDEAGVHDDLQDDEDRGDDDRPEHAAAGDEGGVRESTRSRGRGSRRRTNTGTRPSTTSP